jgi:glycosyltransferase involved in cell wall biosynthesis
VTDSTERAAREVLPTPKLVSVVIPCYNQAHFLDQAIQSSLDQAYSQFEIIIIDDGSNDNTAEVASRYPSVRYVHQKNAGLSSARNAGLRHCRGDLIVFLDADDRLLPHALQTGAHEIQRHPECAFVSGQCRLIDSAGAALHTPVQELVERDHYLRLLRGGNYIWCPATVLYQREIFDFVEGFNPALNPAADYDLYLRITRDFSVSAHDTVVAEYRQHDLSMSRDLTEMQRVALAAHRAQWDIAKAQPSYREAYERGEQFWRNTYPTQQMLRRSRETVPEQMPADGVAHVASKQ